MSGVPTVAIPVNLKNSLRLIILLESLYRSNTRSPGPGAGLVIELRPLLQASSFRPSLVQLCLASGNREGTLPTRTHQNWSVLAVA